MLTKEVFKSTFASPEIKCLLSEKGGLLEQLGSRGLAYLMLSYKAHYPTFLITG